VDLDRALINPVSLPQISNSSCAAVEILYQDDDIVAVSKPPGMPVNIRSQPNRPSRGGRGITPFVKSLYHEAGRVVDEKLFSATGLDINASGVVLFSRQAAGEVASRKLREAMEAPGAFREFLVLVAGPVPAEAGEIDTPLEWTSDVGEVMSQPALTSYEVLLRLPVTGVNLLRVRQHSRAARQVKRHLKSIGCSIVGDASETRALNLRLKERYGLRRKFMHCRRLVLPHPTTGENIEIESALADDLRAFLYELPDFDVDVHPSLTDVGFPNGIEAPRVREVHSKPAVVAKQAAAADENSAKTVPNMLWRDNSVIAFDKPYGVPLTVDASSGVPSIAELGAFCFGEPSIPVHAMETSTSGVALLTTVDASSKTKSALESKDFPAEFVAVVSGSTKGTWEFQNVVPAEGSTEVRTISIAFRRLLSMPKSGLTVLKVRLFSGAESDIVASLKAAEHPVLGDGPDSLGFSKTFKSRLFLHARRRSFSHPVSDEVVKLESPLPSDLRRFLTKLEDFDATVDVKSCDIGDDVSELYAAAADKGAEWRAKAEAEESDSTKPGAPDECTRLIYIDKSLMAVNKPAGLAMVEKQDVGSTPNACQTEAQSFVDDKPIFPALTLERGISGIALFSFTENDRILRESIAKKSSSDYLTLVWGIVPQKSWKHEVDDVNNEDYDRFFYRLTLASYDITRVLFFPQSNCSLLRVRMTKGSRPHLLNYLHEIGHGVVGDVGHGNEILVNHHLERKFGYPRMMMHLRRLSYENTVTYDALDFEAPVPSDFKNYLSGLPDFDSDAHPALCDFGDPEQAPIVGSAQRELETVEAEN